MSSTDEAVVVAWSASAEGSAATARLVDAAGSRLLGVRQRGLSLGHLCPRCGGHGHGRPFVGGRPDLSVSVARTGSATLVAMSSRSPVGVDVEGVMDEAAASEVRTVLLHPAEEAATAAQVATTWVRKEALLKAWGTGLASDPRTVHLSAPAAPARLLTPRPERADDRVWMEDLELAAGLVACVAVVSVRRPDVSVVRVDPEGPSR